LQKKPHRPEDEVDTEGDTKDTSYDHNATFGPGSDIKRGPPEFLIANINSTHIFVFNKFCVYRAQYMLLTADSYQRQETTLTTEDFAAAWKVLNAFDTAHYVFYNCTSDSGNSREHKHMQLFEKPLAGEDGKGFILFPDSKTMLPVPFKYFIEHFKSEPSTEELHSAYENMLGKTREALGLPKDAERCPHNMVLVKEWMMVIPRRKALVGETTVSAAGMLGLVWATTDEDVKTWKSLGPAKVLAEVGVPSS
jgi:ATP adenylyltransferase/5',5'''-P-1,P-4-tetraphosphate phosphorylase II